MLFKKKIQRSCCLLCFIGRRHITAENHCAFTAYTTAGARPCYGDACLLQKLVQRLLAYKFQGQTLDALING